MKFREIFRFELAYQLRNISTWVIFMALLLFAFLMTRDNSLAEALHDDFFLNSPFAIAKTTVMGSLIWLLVAAGIAGEAAARDIHTRMHPLMYTAHLRKSDYLGGRFLAALAINALILLSAQLGILIAVYAPGVDVKLIGPFRPAAYFTSYAYIALPNALVATAVQFLLASQSGKAMAGYLGSVLLFFMSYIVGLFLLFQGRQDLANVLDPIGVHFVLSELSHLWTPTEKSWRLVSLEGTVLMNRLVWVSVAFVALAITWLHFQFTHRTGSSSPPWKGWGGLIKGKWQTARTITMWRRRKRRQQESGSVDSPGSQSPPAVAGPIPHKAGIPVNSLHQQTAPSKDASNQTFGLATEMRQTLAIAWISFQSIAKTWAGLALLVAIPLLMVPVVIDQMDMNGVPLIPKTGRVLSELTAPLVADMSRWVIIPILIIFYAGGLVWRERDAGLGEITGAMPGSEWPPFVGKFLGLGLLLCVFMACLMLAGMLAQLMMDYQHFEIGLYLGVLFGLQLPEYLLFALLALVLHVLADNKYIGHLVTVTAWVLIALAPMFGIEHNMFIFSAGPGWVYTEMSGFGASLAPWFWFKMYWAAWALLLAVVARLLWMRGRDRNMELRFKQARHRFNGATAWIAGTAILLILLVGGFVFFNTNVLNQYQNSADIVERKAEYERRYRQYAGILQPELTGTNLKIEIYPQQRKVDIRGSYRLVNHTGKSLDSIHLATVHGVATGPVILDRTAKLLQSNDDLGHRIYGLERPLQPGDSLRLNFEVHVEPHGFRENGVDPSIVLNGTYFRSGDWLPSIGYQGSRELISATERRAEGLTPKRLIASLYDVEAIKDRGEQIDFEAIVSTDEDQVAVAPGVLRRSWTEKGRRYFHYVTDAPIGAEQFFFSAHYKLHQSQWTDTTGTGQTVAIQIYHQQGHTTNLDRMVRSAQASLDYYSKQFGPYGYSHIRFVEHPGDGDGAGIHAEASMLVYEEGFTLWNPSDEPGNLDHPYAVVAHEMAHQWTVPYAAVEGAPVMSESLAWYYAMKVVEHARGQEQLDLLLRFMQQPHPHPPIRHGEPLLRGLDPYLSYRKGPFALYTLSKYIGEERVNGALRRLVSNHFPVDAPLATTLDLYRELQAATPDSLQYLLHDLFEVNTFWHLKTSHVSAKQFKRDLWQVTVEIEAGKEVVDSAGVETNVPMNDWVEVGVFGEDGKTLYMQKHRIHSGKQSIILSVPEKPVRAGIDPNYLLTDMEREDNVEEVRSNVH